MPCLWRSSPRLRQSTRVLAARRLQTLSSRLRCHRGRRSSMRLWSIFTVLARRCARYRCAVMMTLRLRRLFQGFPKPIPWNIKFIQRLPWMDLITELRDTAIDVGERVILPSITLRTKAACSSALSGPGFPPFHAMGWAITLLTQPFPDIPLQPVSAVSRCYLHWPPRYPFPASVPASAGCS
jgi:hypothetical protein